MKVMKNLMIFMALLGCMLCFEPASAQAVTKVPDFSLSQVGGGHKAIDIKNFRGKVVLVVFWATWCQPCMHEVPSLISLQKEFGPKGFSVIALSVDEGGMGASAVSKVIDKTGINYPVALSTSKVSNAFGGIFGIPTAFMVDRDGNVVKRYNGWTSHEVIASDLKRVLE